ncbi:neck protein [Sinorhizobium phage phiM7]|uniref:Neck protein n=2 Tax=Emdodecavirus TaxID=1980937 RepID=S5M6R7_9CAUD|nr:head-tail adaptor Ad2 [Sinorhizobium phage phiM12]YP_009601211.1 head-tail adaptor Ad2 [Sinorhizobium phage phiM7]AGR47751.1 neck protein [Sinorhizobium phage phiM12]AKF12633.1 neck protein [Sinorhizobium phage phiM7]AKF12993.1 neck protein [Sinorhizobium phage phiM19]
MAKPTTRLEFAELCLRKLGKPVINIDVTDEQVDDCIDEALSYWQDYHFDGSTKVYLKHIVTQEDKDNKYIEISEDVSGIAGVFPLGGSFSSVGMFDVRYQFALNEMANLASFSLVDYYMSVMNIKFMEEILVGRQPIRFNRHENILRLDMNWSKIEVGQYIIIEANVGIDPETYSDVWSDRWFQKYTTAKIKYQWGSNITKFTQGMLPGNIQFNGDKILEDAKEEIRHLEERMQWDGAAPPDDMIG